MREYNVVVTGLGTSGKSDWVKQIGVTVSIETDTGVYRFNIKLKELDQFKDGPWWSCAIDESDRAGAHIFMFDVSSVEEFWQARMFAARYKDQCMFVANFVKTKPCEVIKCNVRAHIPCGTPVFVEIDTNTGYQLKEPLFEILRHNREATGYVQLLG